MVTTAQRLWAARLRSGPLLDLLVALAVFGGSWTLLSHDGLLSSGSGGVDLVGVLLAAPSTLPLVVWRRLPFAVFTVTATVGVVGATMGYGLGIMVGPVVALYLLASNCSAARPWTWASAAAVATVVVVSISVTVASHQGLQATELVHAALPWAVAWFAGDRTRLRRDQIGELRDRARRAEREMEQERLLAAAEERVRIARDLHDSAGHAINVIAVRAGAARLRHHQDPDRSLRALEEIEETARETIEEIDHMVVTLRSGNSANGGPNWPPRYVVKRSTDSASTPHIALNWVFSGAGGVSEPAALLDAKHPDQPSDTSGSTLRPANNGLVRRSCGASVARGSDVVESGSPGPTVGSEVSPCRRAMGLVPSEHLSEKSEADGSIPSLTTRTCR